VNLTRLNSDIPNIAWYDLIVEILGSLQFIKKTPIIRIKLNFFIFLFEFNFYFMEIGCLFCFFNFLFTKNLKVSFSNKKFRKGIEYDLTDVNVDYRQYDYISIWLGYSHTERRFGSLFSLSDLHFDPNTHGRMLETVLKYKKIPLFYSYIIGFAGKYLMGLFECKFVHEFCNTTWETERNLCNKGANFIRSYTNVIIFLYNQYAKEIAKYIGEMGFCVFLIEPEFHQYYGDRNGLSGKEMASLYNLITSIIKSHLPNAAFSWNIDTRKPS
jgi:hypothetical protein